MKVKLAFNPGGAVRGRWALWIIPSLALVWSACNPISATDASDPSATLDSPIVDMIETPAFTDTPMAHPTLTPVGLFASPTVGAIQPLTETIPLTVTIPGMPDSTGTSIKATIDTNCRYGPGPVYDVVGYLLANTSAKVHGRLEAGGWWYIENPIMPGGFCWVWSQTTVIEGDASQLAFVAPPPTPTGSAPLNFTVSYAGMFTCSGTPNFATFSIKNTGFQNLESGEILVVDTWDDKVINKPRVSDSPFQSGPCTSGESRMKPGTVYMISARLISLPARGHARATITLCGEDDLDGGCVQRAVNFSIP